MLPAVGHGRARIIKGSAGQPSSCVLNAPHQLSKSPRSPSDNHVSYSKDRVDLPRRAAVSAGSAARLPFASVSTSAPALESVALTFQVGFRSVALPSAIG